MVIRLQENDIYVREENSNDVEAIDNINTLAFNRAAEKELIRKLRDGQTYVKELSLIADIDVNLASAILFKKSSNQFELVSDAKRKQIGHVMFTKIAIQSDNGKLYNEGILALAPMAVVPGFQKMGVGKKMLEAAIEKAKKLNYKAIVVLGHKEYYSKFGFEVSTKYNIRSPFNVPEENFMVLKLDNIADEITGLAVYPDVFYVV